MAKYYYSDGSISEIYYPDKVLHSEFGPAIVHYSGFRCWYVNGKRHRLDGPAVEYVDGSFAWYINGVYLSKQEFEAHPLRQKYLFEQELEKVLNGR